MLKEVRKRREAYAEGGKEKGGEEGRNKGRRGKRLQAINQPGLEGERRRKGRQDRGKEEAGRVVSEAK